MTKQAIKFFCTFAPIIHQLKTDAPMVYNGGLIVVKKYLVVLSALVLFAFSSCQKFAGKPVTKDFSISGNYTELEVQNAFEVTVSDAVEVVTVTVGENVMPKVVVEVVDNTLRIRIKDKVNFYGGEMKAVIPYNAHLTSVDLSGASEFRSEYGLEGEKVEVDLSGASDFYCDINADEIDMNLSGASKIEGGVSATELYLDLSGASDATLTGQVATLKVDLSGASNIKKTVVGDRYGLATNAKARCRAQAMPTSIAMAPSKSAFLGPATCTLPEPPSREIAALQALRILFMMCCRKSGRA